MSSGTSITKSRKPAAPQRVFATLRFSGDKLDPDRISEILRAVPTRAYRKGERYFDGPYTGHLVGRTGIWFIATDDVVASADINRHLDYLVGLIFRGPAEEDRLAQLREMMARDGVKADVSCFWHGEAGEKVPSIRGHAIKTLRDLPAEIETDFDASC
jgi:hypothetical protein